MQLRKVAQVDSCRHTEVVDRQSWKLSIFVYLGAHCFMSEDAKVAQIASLTGLSAEQAKFFLDSCGGDEEAAINTYLETQAEEAVSNSGDEPDSEANQAREESSTPQRETVAKERQIMTDKQSSSKPPKKGGVATLRDLLPEEPSPEEESGKNYYAGGERSGQMIQDPRRPPRNDGDNELTRKIFQKAMQYSERPEEEVEDFSNRQRFTGAGYRLGDGTEESTFSEPVVVGRKNVVKTLTFYKNGFQVDEGPLREYSDPANQQFLREVESGYVPREMEEPGIGHVSINLVDKKDEEYVPPKPKLQPFTGRGYRLMEGTQDSNLTAASSSSDSGSRETERVPVQADPTKPTTSIQIRLHDGTRLVARFNEDQTLGDVRRFVSSARPLPPNTNFELSLQFPRQVLSEDSKTISELGLKGSVIVQTLK